MKGQELIEKIKKNNWEDTDIFVATQGYCSRVTNVEPLFPKLANTNEIVLSDDCYVEQDQCFWKMFYENYMNIVPVDAVREHPERYYCLYCDGTEGMMYADTDVDDLYNKGCLFGVEKTVE